MQRRLLTRVCRRAASSLLPRACALSVLTDIHFTETLRSPRSLLYNASRNSVGAVCNGLGLRTFEMFTVTAGHLVLSPYRHSSSLAIAKARQRTASMKQFRREMFRVGIGNDTLFTVFLARIMQFSVFKSTLNRYW